MAACLPCRTWSTLRTHFTTRVMGKQVKNRYTSRFVRVILAQGPCWSSLCRSKFNGWSPKGIQTSVAQGTHELIWLPSCPPIRIPVHKSVLVFLHACVYICRYPYVYFYMYIYNYIYIYISINIYVSSYSCMSVYGHNYSIIDTPSQDRAGDLQRVRLTS